MDRINDLPGGVPLPKSDDPNNPDAPIKLPSQGPSKASEQAWADAMKDPESTEQSKSGSSEKDRLPDSDSKSNEPTTGETKESQEPVDNTSLASVENSVNVANEMDQVLVNLMQTMMRQDSAREANRARGDAGSQDLKADAAKMNMDMNAKEKANMEKQGMTLGASILQRLDGMSSQAIIPQEAEATAPSRADKIEDLIQKMVKGVQVTDPSIEQNTQVRLQLDEGFLKGAEIVIEMTGPDELKISIEHDDQEVIDSLNELQEAMQSELSDSLSSSMPNTRVAVNFGVRGESTDEATNG